jgi:uncharacterized protein (DUF433 family)
VKAANGPDLYGGRDPREVPTYNAINAAHYLRVPERTIRNWCFGRSWSTPAGRARTASGVIRPADSERRLLSFVNLVELHVLDSIRREHRIGLENVRRAVGFLSRKFETAHPLADVQMETNGKDLFVQRLGQLINASREGQLAMREVLEKFLRRIDRDPRGVAIRLFPFTRLRSDQEPSADAPRLVAIDPRVAFGRPVLTGSRIPTVEIAERFMAGESFESLAADYARPIEEIEEAIRCEFDTAA